MSEKIDIEFGDKIIITERFVRRQRVLKKFSMWRYWEPVPFCVTGCIFLGSRFLQNGIRELDNEYGYTFDAHERFKVALVSPGKGLNPVYVPIGSISHD